MTDEERQDCERFIDEGTIRQHTALAVASCLEAHDAAMALARRVHAECVQETINQHKQRLSHCMNCHREGIGGLVHEPGCLWLAADALLRKAGEL